MITHFPRCHVNFPSLSLSLSLDRLLSMDRLVRYPDRPLLRVSSSFALIPPLSHSILWLIPIRRTRGGMIASCPAYTGAFSRKSLLVAFPPPFSLLLFPLTPPYPVSLSIYPTPQDLITHPGGAHTQDLYISSIFALSVPFTDGNQGWVLSFSFRSFSQLQKRRWLYPCDVKI